MDTQLLFHSQSTLGAALRSLRRERRLSLAVASRLTGLPIATLSKVENGKRSLTYDKLLQVSKGFGVDIARLFSDHAIDEVWKLYALSCQRTGLVATLYEWDDDIPAFEVVLAEARKAEVFRKAVSGPGPRKSPTKPAPVPLTA